MAQYIDKSTLVAEIERLKDELKASDSAAYVEAYIIGAEHTIKTISDVIDTLEVKEVGEKSVSEGLEEASKEWLRPQLDKSYANYGEAKMMELTHFDGYAMLDAIEFGAQWQKAKDQSCPKDLGEYINKLSKQFPEVSFAKLSRIAVRVAKWQKEQIKRAMDLGEPPYLISIEQAYYRTLKLLEE